MFQTVKPRTKVSSIINIFELIYHTAVRSIRKTHRNALAALLINMLQVATFVIAFVVMFEVLGMKGARMRGDFIIYIMTGIFLYMTHIKAMGAVAGAEGPTSPMMQHAPMNTVVSITAAALGALYIQVISMFVILFIYYVGFTKFYIYDAVGAMAMVILAWFTGCAVGLVVMAAKPWAPQFVNILNTVYQRANMIASGKMFVANSLPPMMVKMFDWNPPFHAIDQCRGFAFKDYFPRNSNWEYAFWVGVVFVVLGLMLEYYTRQHASSSWTAKE